MVVALLVSAGVAHAGAAVSRTRLSITVWPQGVDAGAVERYGLACAPARGTVPRPARACAVLRRAGASAFAPTPPLTVCTQISGGPAQARVRGIVAGHAVDAAFSLTNGCEIARWTRLAAVVPRPTWH
jgi:hypothetical protein